MNNEELVRQNAHDMELVKLVALRKGLCDLISKKIIKLNFAIHLFHAEHKAQIMNRL